MNTNTSDSNKQGCGGCTGISWWATLVVAVLAVPSFGIIVSTVVPVQGLGQIVVFVLACWLCTYLGMWLMKKPGMSDTINLNKK